MRTRADSPTKTCTEPGCGNPLRARGLCSTHYNQTHQPDRHAKVAMTCDGCGTSMRKEPSRTNRYAKVYCTSQCRDDHHWLDLRASKRQVVIYRPAPLWHRTLTHLIQHTPPTTTRVFKAGRCEVCASPFVDMYGSLACSEDCQRERWRSVAREGKHRRRARQHEAFVAPVRRHTVYARDGWTCQLCMTPLNMNAHVPEPDAPTIDHITPLARGGTHEPDNVQAAHFLCNSLKGDRIAA